MELDVVGELPLALSAQVLASLGADPRDLASASTVCRRWRDAVKDGDAWAAAYAARFPAWGSERWLGAGSGSGSGSGSSSGDPQALPWQQRYRWRAAIDRNWRQGRRRLQRVLHGPAAWVNAVKLLPGEAGVASGGSEGALHVWGLDGGLLLSAAPHNEAVWSLDADARQIATGGMDGWVLVHDSATGQVTARLPAGWRGLPPGELADADWQAMDVVTSVQLLPGGRLLLAGCMNGSVQLFDLRCPSSGRQQGRAGGGGGTPSPPQPVQQLQWLGRGAAPGAAGQGQGLFWRGSRGGGARLCSARCHEHLLVAAGDAAVVTLHDMRQAGACCAELALPASGRVAAPPSVFALDLLYPRLATAGDGGCLQVWDLSKAQAGPGTLPAASQRQASLWPPSSSTSSFGSAASASSACGSPAAASVDCLVGTNEGHLPGLDMGCVYGVKLLEDWRVLTADHGGHVRLWGAGGEAGRGTGSEGSSGSGSGSGSGSRSGSGGSGSGSSGSRSDSASGSGSGHGGSSGAAAAAGRAGGGGRGGPCRVARGESGGGRLELSAWSAFAPSLDDPQLAVQDPQGGPPQPVGVHSVDACLTHLAVAGRDGVVRLYSYE